MQSDKYYYKYLKYKEKYLSLKENLNKGINKFKSVFDNNFSDKWILTGSEAIKIYLYHINRKDLIVFEPNDVDIIYISKDLFYRDNFNGFKRTQTEPYSSMTFTNPDKLSFDVTTQSEPAKYYMIEGIKLMNPKVMLDNYETNVRNETDKDKIIALKEIIKVMNEDNMNKLFPDGTNPKRSRLEDEDPDNENHFGRLSRSLF